MRTGEEKDDIIQFAESAGDKVRLVGEALGRAVALPARLPDGSTVKVGELLAEIGADIGRIQATAHRLENVDDRQFTASRDRMTPRDPVRLQAEARALEIIAASGLSEPVVMRRIMEEKAADWTLRYARLPLENQIGAILASGGMALNRLRHKFDKDPTEQIVARDARALAAMLQAEGKGSADLADLIRETQNRKAMAILEHGLPGGEGALGFLLSGAAPNWDRVCDQVERAIKALQAEKIADETPEP